MKVSVTIAAALLAGAAALSGCDTTSGNFITVAAQDIANVVSNSSKACADIATLGGDVSSVAAQVGASNPNNASIQAIVSKVNAGGALANSDCQALAKAFTAEAPKSLLTHKVKLNAAAWAKVAH